MEIDIINFTDAQYASLTKGQLSKVRIAQSQKNDLTWKLQADLQRAKDTLVNNRIFNSNTYERIAENLQAKYDQELEVIRDGLLFYLQYSMRPEYDVTGAPYTVDYSYTVEERLKIVKGYYETAYTDGAERFTAFKNDKIAPSYLAELYAPLYDYIAGLARE